jgi:hypothetical protein
LKAVRKEEASGTSERFHASRNNEDAGFALLIPVENHSMALVNEAVVTQQ